MARFALQKTRTFAYKISATNSLLNQELQSVLIKRIIIVEGIRVIQYQFR